MQMFANLSFCKQIVLNLQAMQNKKRKYPQDRELISREYNQLMSQLDITIMLLRLFENCVEPV